MNRLTQSITAEYASRGVRCNAILPGFVNSPLPAGNYSDKSHARAATDLREAMSPMGQVGTGLEAAHAALFLASDEA